MIVQDANVQNSNDFYFSSSKPQESKRQEQILHDEKTIEQMRHDVQSLCSDLLGKEYGQDFNSNMWLDSFLKYTSRDNSRLFYSTISYFIFEIDDEKYADLSIHLSSILQEANQRFKDQKIDHQSYKAILKFYDHITLANQQKLMVDRRSQSLHKEIQQEIKEEVKSGILIANKSYSLPADYAPGVSEEAQSAFEEMAAGAAQDGINLYIASGFRSYDYQAKLYQRYVDRDGKEKADTYSARPGHSEHQTGLAFDLNEVSDAFIGTPEAEWLAAHAHEYGFIIRYPADKVEITGYKYEPWHVRYLGKETAAAVYESGLCLEEYLGIDSVYAD